MAEPLKSFFSLALVSRLAAELARVEPSFPIRRFVEEAGDALDGLELMARARQIARAMRHHLPGDYAAALEVIVQSLGPEHAADELLGSGMGPFYYLPHTMFVSEYGLDDFERSLRAQHALTKRFTAEWSIRAFLAKDPERTIAQLREWATDENAHVRRLVSEGTRLRLPWGSRVAWLDANPGRILELLEVLKDDPTALVRRSVANNVNDLGKVHAELTVTTCTRWLRTATPATGALVRQALRSLVKKGHRGALEALGVGATPRVKVVPVDVPRAPVPLGASFRFAFIVLSLAPHDQELVVDYAVHFVKASGSAHPKVFKLRRITLGASESFAFSGKVSLAAMTTRRHYAGLHRVEVLVNGVGFHLGDVEVVPREGGSSSAPDARARR
jgi:3-methyladenine DNA glycosylase AlkC